MEQASPLDSSVLVLNKFFAAVHVCSARHAFNLLYRDHAEVVSIKGRDYRLFNFESWKEVSQLRDSFDVDHEEYVRTVSFRIRVPRIIRLLFYDKLPRRVVKITRRNVYERDGNRCQYCGKTFPTSELSVDHVVPRALGGFTVWTNVVCACTGCNARKGGRLPAQAGMRLVRPARAPRRSPTLLLKLRSGKYESWKQFIDEAYWSVELE